MGVRMLLRYATLVSTKKSDLLTNTTKKAMFPQNEYDLRIFQGASNVQLSKVVAAGPCSFGKHWNFSELADKHVDHVRWTLTSFCGMNFSIRPRKIAVSIYGVDYCNHGIILDI